MLRSTEIIQGVGSIGYVLKASCAAGGDGAASPVSRQPSQGASRRTAGTAAGGGGGPLLPPPLLLGGEPTWATQAGPVTIPGEDVLSTPNPITSQVEAVRRLCETRSRQRKPC